MVANLLWKRKMGRDCVEDKCTCATCGAKSLYIQFFEIDGKYYCRICYTEKLMEEERNRE
ncbi:hypothetical protein SAMN06265361_107114 [Laceyella tengchongensis]|uniref:LIM zinc-binding domain-containing protein n=1 Tax=Laceyella tengchongensis TaxID=574699 RepID=A0AA45WRE0_9BACL|nr:hypothetical protein SAMN06265361_107114 [Laceyella tengchongensis]